MYLQERRMLGAPPSHLMQSTSLGNVHICRRGTKLPATYRSGTSSREEEAVEDSSNNQFHHQDR